MIQFKIYERTHPDYQRTFLDKLINNSNVTTLNDYSNTIRTFPFCRIQIWNVDFEHFRCFYLWYLTNENFENFEIYFLIIEILFNTC